MKTFAFNALKLAGALFALATSFGAAVVVFWVASYILSDAFRLARMAVQ